MRRFFLPAVSLRILWSLLWLDGSLTRYTYIMRLRVHLYLVNLFLIRAVCAQTKFVASFASRPNVSNFSLRLVNSRQLSAGGFGLAIYFPFV